MIQDSRRQLRLHTYQRHQIERKGATNSKIGKLIEVEYYSNAYNKAHRDRSKRKQYSLRSRSSKIEDVSQVTVLLDYNRVKLIPESDNYKKTRV